MTRPPQTRPKQRLWPAPALGLALALGCAPDEDFPLPPIVWEGEQVRVRMDDPGIEVCGGTFEALDRHAALVREALLLEGDGVVEYSIGDEDFVDAACNLDSPIACTKGATGRVFTSSLLDQHEIVHAVRVMDSTIRLQSSAVEEGLATLFGSDELGNRTEPLEVLAILNEERVGGSAEYFRAGHTIAILFERHGVEAFRRFDVLRRTMDEAEAFMEAFGESKEQFATGAEAAPICEQTQWWVPLLECDGEPLTADPTTDALILTGDLSCAEPDVQGPQAGRMWTTRRFRLDRSTNHLLYSLDIPDDATLEVVACEGGCPERFAYIGTRYDVGSFANGLPALEPGEYFLRVSRPVSGEEGRFRIALH